MARPVPVALTIAGSDSGGGAGIQADLKAFAAAGAHGASAITALTAQNTTGVAGVHPVPPAFVREQVRAVTGDLGVDAVKTGMLGSAEMVATVAELLAALPAGTPVVVDPVMVAESGARLLDEDAVRAVVERLLPVATVITPNVPEALVLAEALGERIDPQRPDAAEQAARVLHAGRSGSGGPAWVVVTGGHREELVDTVFDGHELLRLPGERHPDGAAHGSGCTHASTLAVHLARGATVPDAARAAQAAASRAVRDGRRELGDGPGPVDVLGLEDRARREPAVPPGVATDLS